MKSWRDEGGTCSDGTKPDFPTTRSTVTYKQRKPTKITFSRPRHYNALSTGTYISRYRSICRLVHTETATIDNMIGSGDE